MSPHRYRYWTRPEILQSLGDVTGMSFILELGVSTLHLLSLRAFHDLR